MSKRDYLARQRAVQNGIAAEAFFSGFQKCYDLMIITLHDAEVMGRDAYGRERIKKVQEGMMKWENILHDAWTGRAEADYLQEKTDALLREVFGDETEPFAVRHPGIVQPGYNKKWKE